MSKLQQNFSPLKGVRVIDFTRLLPGPYATELLVGMGAEVIKVEDTGKGDYVRHLMPKLFSMMNRSKKGIAVNYKIEAGRELVLKMIANADVVIEGFSPGAMDHWKLGYEDAKAIRSDIIYCSLSGFGLVGPLVNRAGHDPQYTAEAGLVGIRAKMTDGEYDEIYPPVADLGGGLNAVLAIAAALYSRERTGEGAYLDIALSDIPASWAIACSESDMGVVPKAAFNFYKTKDGRVMSLGNLEPHFWVNFCKAVGRDDLADRAADLEAVPLVAELIASKTAEEWTVILKDEKVCWAMATSPEEMSENELLRARGYVIDAADEGSVLTPILAFARPSMPDAPAPATGGNTREILASVGLSADEISNLEQQGVVVSS
ncbi:MAG: CoA transferase [Coriobacteriia bacterium]|nr:CoA transferase [Coriobacteriia bacterium]MCL2749639.1 CoA transferase [Coriobacteriia bacterium]